MSVVGNVLLCSIDENYQLSTFCNVHKVIPDVKVVSNLPALSMEETIPSAVSDATLLAPQEVEVCCRMFVCQILELMKNITS